MGGDRREQHGRKRQQSEMRRFHKSKPSSSVMSYFAPRMTGERIRSCQRHIGGADGGMLIRHDDSGMNSRANVLLTTRRCSCHCRYQGRVRNILQDEFTR
jgi:hypothetical protein